MIISETPLRISFAGGGTDLRAFYEVSEGTVLSAAIDKYVYVVVKERFDEKIYINYSKKEIVDSVDEIEHELVREAMKKAGVKAGVEITTLADIPSEGSGLGSSSSITVGLLNALYTYKGNQVTAEKLAQDACDIEIGLCGKPIGKQDQYIAAYGGFRKTTFFPDESVTVEDAALPSEKIRELGKSLMLFYTNKSRKADEILIRQQENTRNQREALETNKALADELALSFKKGDIEVVGSVLKRNWELKKTFADNISGQEIDDMYQKAIHAGAVGGKICGAGGGGFLLLYVPVEKHAAVKDSLQDYRELPFLFEPYGSKIIFNFMRYPVK